MATLQPKQWFGAVFLGAIGGLSLFAANASPPGQTRMTALGVGLFFLAIPVVTIGRQLMSSGGAPRGGGLADVLAPDLNEIDAIVSLMLPAFEPSLSELKVRLVPNHLSSGKSVYRATIETTPATGAKVVAPPELRGAVEALARVHQTRGPLKPCSVHLRRGADGSMTGGIDYTQ